MFLVAVGAPFIFGYAKPVPVNFHNLGNPKRDMIWVAAAGPVPISSCRSERLSVQSVYGLENLLPQFLQSPLAMMAEFSVKMKRYARRFQPVAGAALGRRQGSCGHGA